jgi:peptidoglycan/LPS O-acetylase OafA/YrhL
VGGLVDLRHHLEDRADWRAMTSRVLAYRPDIDGLRAVAIIPVVAFHAFPEWVSGGFVGVDVFFVISGYLISLIILERLNTGSFSLGEFYARRIRRLFPALATVLLVCLAWGWFYLYAADYAQLGKHVAAGSGFVANLVLWSEAGYFDTVSEAKPLLHLWSLGIEEQFYFFWPSLLFVTWRARLNPLVMLALVFSASFLLNVVQVRTDEVSAFFSPLTRLWELLLGGSLAYIVLAQPSSREARWLERARRLTTPTMRNLAAIVGLMCIVVAVAVFNADTSFPGWRAAVPTVGALLLIAAGREAFVNRVLLSSPLLVWIGLISYPLYLWHWPLLSFATLSVGTPSAELRAAIVAASVAAAWLTYAAIERPVRFSWRGATPIVVLCALMTAAGLAGYVTFAAEGFHDRAINRSDKAHFLEYYERLRTRGLADAYRAECDFMDWSTEKTRGAIADDCTRPGEQGTVFLWGDSHAQALSLGIRDALPPGVRLAQVTTSACPPRLRESNPLALDGRCERANAFARDRIAATRPSVVVLAQILAHEQTDWLEIARAIRELGAGRVVLVGPAPQWMPSLPLVVATNYWDADFHRVARGLNQELFQTDRILRERLGESAELEYVSLLSALCNGEGCLAVAPDTGQQLMTADNGHFSPAGSIHVGRTILAPVVLGN